VLLRSYVPVSIMEPVHSGTLALFFIVLEFAMSLFSPGCLSPEKVPRSSWLAFLKSRD
jgi:hypothetical protein